jgi:hypothetical protein
MSETLPNWDLRRIPASGPYVRVLARGCPAFTGSRFALLHPQMERGHRAKIFAPFDALEGFSDRIRTRDDTLVRAMEKSGR